MDAAEEPVCERPVLPRRTIQFAVATWVAIAALLAIYALFWRIAYAPPYAVWAIITTGAVLFSGALAVFFGGWQLIRGPRRLLACATMVLGTTPIVWFAMFLLALYLQAMDRKPTRYNPAAERTIGFWAASLADLEARWRYPQWTEGQHVILLDDGSISEPTKLVAQMDQHIEQMAARLHAGLPSHKVRWVRGSLLFLHGQEFASWAICDADQSSPDLTYVDRHEVAHALIEELCSVDQDPPMLLGEGWAETQSRDRADLIMSLNAKVEKGTSSSLQELIKPEWYGRSFGPAYDHGGPLVVYLMEHYGADQFLKLYRTVRYTTFAEDCQRVLGDTWLVVEQGFWKWLASEAAKLKAERGEKPPPPSKTDKDVTLAKSVNPRDWQTIVDGYRAAWAKRPTMPKTCAFAVEHNWTAPPNNSDKLPPKHDELTECVVDGESVWQVKSYQPSGRVDCVVFTPTLAASSQLSAEGRVIQCRKSTQQDVTWALEYGEIFASLGDLGHFLPINPQRHYDQTIRIDAIHPPVAPDQSIWKIDYAYRNPEDKSETSQRLEIDAAADWLVVDGYDPVDRSRGESHYKSATILGRKSTAELNNRSTDKQGEWTLHNRIRELTRAEAQQVREKAEKLARLQPERNWLAPLLRPMTLAIAWPTTGVLLLSAGILLNRRQKRALLTSASSETAEIAI
jgi:hypothetical protein